MTDETKMKLKAFFSYKFFAYGDVRGRPYDNESELALEGFSLKAVNRVIDEFDEREKKA